MFAGTGGSTVRTISTVLSADDQATEDLNRAEDAGDRASESLEQTEDRLDNVTQAFKLAGGAAVALGGSIALLTARFGRLDQQFATIRTTSGATADEMARIREATQDISTALPVTLAQSAEAAKQLSFAGLSASETMAALGETAELAVASNLRAGQAAQTVARSLNAFQLEARQTDAVVGSLSATFASSATNIQSLAQGLTEGQATASAAGLSVAETTGTLGVLASSGLAGSKAGTSLNAVLRRLTSASGETQEALARLGLSMESFTTSEGDLRNITAIMGTLSESMGEVSSEAQRIRTAQQLVGAEGARALLPLLEQTDTLANKVNANLRAEIQGAIGDLGEMDGSELEGVSEALGMEVSGETTPQELVANLQTLAEQGESTEDIVARLQVGLGLTGDAARLLAEDIAETNTSASELADQIGGVVTAEQLAEEQTETLRGQIQQLRSNLQVLGYQMYQGTAPATMTLVSGLNALAGPLAGNKTAARALGGALVLTAGAATIATVALGAMAVQLKLAALAEAGLVSQTYAGTAALYAKSAATSAATTATWLLTASTGTLIAATKTKAAALYGSAAAALADASAKGIMTTATLAAAGAATTLWAALGPIGWLVLGISAAVLGLAAIIKTDFMGAGEEAAMIFGWLGEKADATMAILSGLWNVIESGARLLGTLGLAAVLGPFGLLLRLPGMLRGVNWREVGFDIVSGIARGIVPGPIGAALGSTLAVARQFLPSSPAERGPMSDLDAVGPGLINTVASGIDSEAPALSASLERALAVGSAITRPQRRAVGMAADAASSAAGGGDRYQLCVEQEITVADADATEETVARASRRGASAFEQMMRRLERETKTNP